MKMTFQRDYSGSGFPKSILTFLLTLKTDTIMTGSTSTQINTETTITSNTTIVHINAPTHLPTKLTESNFLVWRTQLNSALIGLDIFGYIDGSLKPPTRLQNDGKPNPLYSIWNRQDKVIINAIHDV